MHDVYLHYLPVESPDNVVLHALAPFGTVHSIVGLNHPRTSIGSGVRLVKMSLSSDIPVNLRILRYPCSVYYTGQPRFCSICRSPHHRASDCPLRDVCRRFRQPGHFARDCHVSLDDPAPSVAGPAPPADDPAPPVDDVAPSAASGSDMDDNATASDDDAISSEDELASGDEEVLRSAPAPSDSPVRTRASKRPRVAASVPPVPPVPAAVPAPVPALAPAPVPAPASDFVPPAAAPPVPTDFSPLLHVGHPTWIAKVSESVKANLSARLHSKYSHVSCEFYVDGRVPVVFDFGSVTRKYLMETCFPEEDRLGAYTLGSVVHPVASPFAAVATDLPALPADVVPACFPAPRS